MWGCVWKCFLNHHAMLVQVPCGFSLNHSSFPHLLLNKHLCHSSVHSLIFFWSSVHLYSILILHSDFKVCNYLPESITLAKL